MKSWSFCENCGKLTCRKLLPSFRTSTLSPLEKSCKCGNHIYSVPQVEDVPLLLRNLTITDIRVLRPFDIHCGEYKHVIHGYRQRTGPFRVTWSALTVQDKIQGIEDAGRRRTLQKILIFSWLKKILLTPNSYLCNVEERRSLSFTKFSQRHNTKVWNVRSGHLFIIHQSFVKLVSGETSRKSGNISFLHKVLSPVLDYSVDFELLQFQYDRWLFKTITGAINSSRDSGCSPNAALQHKSFSATFWNWQHLYLLDALRQYGLPSVRTNRHFLGPDLSKSCGRISQWSPQTFLFWRHCISPTC